MVEFLPYKPNSKVRCPKCGRAKSLTLYRDSETLEVFPSEFGKCDRIMKCGFHNRPDSKGKGVSPSFIPEPVKPIDYLPMSELEERMMNPKENHFFTWLCGLVGDEGLKVLKERYRLGTSTIYNGLVSFPQIDTKKRLRRIKEMRYNPNNGKRSKTLGSQRWAFEKRLFPDMNLEQVYFGSHLIIGNDKPVALVESEKTALICSHFMSKFTWLATGSLGMLSNERCKHLRGRELFLFPDLGATEVWAKKARYLKGLKRIRVSKYLEEKANEFNLKKGDDLADLLITELKNRNE